MDRFITALRAGRPEHTPEAEGVLVASDGSACTLTLDDGETLTFDVAELLSAVMGEARHDAGLHEAA